MGPQTEFADLLTELLANESVSRTHGCHSIATQPFLWLEGGAITRATAAGVFVLNSHAPWESVARPGTSSSPLSSTHQRALDTLNALGANIGRDFSPEELRRAFRGLALRYHPDRHTSRSEAERAQLAALFGRAHDAYEQLKSVTRPVAH